ncbi:MAG TPA: helix-turn-helix domain-containing protein [Terriglobia bacterium]|nr:helix-turn-helix domain-containing protein [Terriglobia bacterium]
MKKRLYRMTKRAELEKQTRQRITESAVKLHGTVGPSRTSIWAIAEHAGVRRSTVYRHFPDEAALFAACTSHWMAANPLPDLGRWAAVGDADERLRLALTELYAFYRRTERMMINILRDEEIMPMVRKKLGGYRRYLVAARETLRRGRRLRLRARRRVPAALGHALAFPVWHSLTHEQGLDDAECADLMRLLVAEASR